MCDIFVLAARRQSGPNIPPNTCWIGRTHTAHADVAQQLQLVMMMMMRRMIPAFFGYKALAPLDLVGLKRAAPNHLAEQQMILLDIYVRNAARFNSSLVPAPATTGYTHGLHAQCSSDVGFDRRSNNASRWSSYPSRATNRKRQQVRLSTTTGAPLLVAEIVSARNWRFVKNHSHYISWSIL